MCSSVAPDVLAESSVIASTTNVTKCILSPPPTYTISLSVSNKNHCFMKQQQTKLKQRKRIGKVL